jgi:NitT/TauT family transport system substrate-binding protein
MKFKTALLTVALFSMIGFNSHALEAKTKNVVTLQITGIPEGRMSGIAYGIVHGIYAEEGIDLTITRGKGSVGVIKALESGETRFGIADAIAIAQSVSEGSKVKMIASVVPVSIFGFVFVAGRGIRSVNDLKGKKIGRTKGSSSELIIPAFLKANGLSESDVKFVDVTTENRTQKLASGEVDAIVRVIPSIRTAELATEKKMGAFLFSSYGLPIPGEGIVVALKSLETDAEKDLNCRMIKAMSKSWREAVSKPEEAAKAIVKLFPDVDGGHFDATLYGWKKTAEIASTRKSLGKQFGFAFDFDWQRLLSILKEYKIIKEPLTLDHYFTNEFTECPVK